MGLRQKIGELFFELTAQPERFKREMRQAEDAAEAAADNMSASAAKAEGGFRRVGDALTGIQAAVSKLLIPVAIVTALAGAVATLVRWSKALREENTKGAAAAAEAARAFGDLRSEAERFFAETRAGPMSEAEKAINDYGRAVGELRKRYEELIAKADPNQAFWFNEDLKAFEAESSSAFIAMLKKLERAQKEQREAQEKEQIASAQRVIAAEIQERMKADRLLGEQARAEAEKTAAARLAAESSATAKLESAQLAALDRIRDRQVVDVRQMAELMDALWRNGRHKR